MRKAQRIYEEIKRECQAFCKQMETKPEGGFAKSMDQERITKRIFKDLMYLHQNSVEHYNTRIKLGVRILPKEDWTLDMIDKTIQNLEVW